MSEPAAAVSAPSPVLTERTYRLPWMRPFLEAMSRIPNATAAARHAGISRDRVYEVRETDPDFRAAWEEAKQVGLDLLEQIVHRRSTTGEEVTITRTRVRTDSEGNVIERETVETTQLMISNTLLLRLLAAHRPERWSDRTDIRLSGGDRPIQVEVGPLPRSPERAAELVEIMRDEGVLDAVLQNGSARVPTNGDAPEVA